MKVLANMNYLHRRNAQPSFVMNAGCGASVPLGPPRHFHKTSRLEEQDEHGAATKTSSGPLIL